MLDEGYLGQSGRILAIHKKFIDGLNHLNETTCKGQLREAGGMGLMIAVTPLDGSKDKVNKLLQVLYKNGMIANITCDCWACGICKHGVAAVFALKSALEKIEKHFPELNQRFLAMGTYER